MATIAIIKFIQLVINLSTYMAKYREPRFYSTASKTGFRGFDSFDQFTIDQATYLHVSSSE